MTDRQWNGAIGGGALPVGNVRIPAKPEPPRPEAKPVGASRVGRIFDQTGDVRDCSKHDRGAMAVKPYHDEEFRREIIGEWCVETALSAEIERIIQAMWRVFSGGLPVETMAPENRDRFTRMAKAARRELRRSDLQPQQSNEEKNADLEWLDEALAQYREAHQKTSRYKLTRADDVTPCWHCGQRPALHREFGGAHNHVFVPRPQDNALTTEDKAALKLDNDALTFAMGGTWMTEKDRP